MEATLLRFIRHLRHHGLEVSPAESLDAMRVAASLGYSDRSLLHAGLACSLAKSEEERIAFDQCFNRFFTLGERSEIVDETVASEEGDSPSSSPDDTDIPPMPGDSAEGEGSGGGGGSGLSMDALRAEVMQAANEVGLEKMEYPTQRGVYRRRILDALGDGEQRQAIAGLADGSPDDQQQAQWLSRLREARIEAVTEVIDRQLLLNNNAKGRSYQEELMRDSSIAAMDSYYRKRLPPLIRKLAKKLASRHRQRLHRAKRGKPDLGKTLRRNLAYGGVPFHRYFRNTRREKSEIYLLCDLSGSVSQWSEVLMLFVQALADVLPNARCFVFCGKSIEVSDIFRQYPEEEALATIQRQHGMGGSDYGLALTSFRDQIADRLNRRSTVIILGDGRGNGGNTGIDALRDIYHRARLVLWFNPESRNRWNTGDSEIRRYQTACHYVAECGSLRKLERLLDDLLNLIR